MNLTKEEMKSVSGGALTSAMINAVNKVINTIYELGRATGSAIVRIVTKTTCPLVR